MTKIVTLILVAAIATTALWIAGVGADAGQTVECDGGFPIYDDLASTEAENEARIDCVDDRRAVIQERMAERRSNRAAVTERIRELRARRDRINARLKADRTRLDPLTMVSRLLTYVRGDVSWTYSTAFCETGGTMDPHIHSDSGSYHGLGQFAYHWGSDLDWFKRFGAGDPHDHHAIVQGSAMVELKREGGAQHWPVCGD